MTPSGTVLLVDDTPEVLALIWEALEPHGWRLLVADSARAARGVLAHTQPDLILLDVRMPGEDGFELHASLRQAEATARIPVIFLTSLNDPTEKVRAFQGGAVDYVTKPVHGPELAARVSLHLELRAARRDLERKNRELETAMALRLDAEACLADSLRHGLALLHKNGSLLFATRLAHSLIAKHLPGQDLARRLSADCSVSGPKGSLHIQSIPAEGNPDIRIISLREDSKEGSPESLLAQGLTPRQAEVAYWVAQGKTNPEIGLILGTSPRTIDKHMEHILQKTSVENRASLIVLVTKLLEQRT